MLLVGAAHCPITDRQDEAMAVVPLIESEHAVLVAAKHLVPVTGKLYPVAITARISDI